LCVCVLFMMKSVPVTLCVVFSEGSPSLRGPVGALCFSHSDALLLAGYESGLLEIWQQHALVGQKQVKTCATR